MPGAWEFGSPGGELGRLGHRVPQVASASHASSSHSKSSFSISSFLLNGGNLLHALSGEQNSS